MREVIAVLDDGKLKFLCSVKWIRHPRRCGGLKFLGQWLVRGGENGVVVRVTGAMDGWHGPSGRWGGIGKV